MSSTQLRGLKKRPMFRSNVIDMVIADGPDYTKKSWEDDLNDYQTDTGVERY